MKKKIFYEDDKFLEIELPERGNVGVLLSGGENSSILTYLLSRIIDKENLETNVIPFTAENLNLPYSLSCSHSVLKKITDLTNITFRFHPCFIIPNFFRKMDKEEKRDVVETYTNAFCESYKLTTIFCGASAPNIDHSNDYDSKFLSSENSLWCNALKDNPKARFPFKEMTQQGIASLYRKYSRIDDLLPLTRSCTMNMGESKYFSNDCFDVREKGDECPNCQNRDKYFLRGGYK
jgi:hypothetical protein